MPAGSRSIALRSRLTSRQVGDEAILPLSRCGSQVDGPALLREAALVFDFVIHQDGDLQVFPRQFGRSRNRAVAAQQLEPGSWQRPPGGYRSEEHTSELQS